MQRLTGADATFLFWQTPNAHMEVASCMILDGENLPRGEDLLAHAHRYFEPRLHLVPQFRRRVVRVPFGLDLPLWIEDPNFDLDYHLRHAALPAPGRRDQLCDLIGRLLSRPLDQSRPLWEMYLVEGLKKNRVALFVKAHHAMVDGVAGFQLLTSLIDLAPDSAPPAPPEREWRPERLPSELELMAGSTANLIRQPWRGMRTLRRLVSSALEARRTYGSATALLGETGAPETRFNRPISPHRRIRFLDLSLEELKDLKTRSGTKINDVVLAIVSGGMRRYLERRGELPETSMVAFVPVSIRADGEVGGNQTSMMHVLLASDLATPLERLGAIAESSQAAKAKHEHLGPSVLTDISQIGGAAMASAAFRVIEAMRLEQRTRLGGNVVVSNIPGPPFALYTFGARIERLYPIGPVSESPGLNITLLSYCDTVGFSIHVDRDSLPDIDELVADLRYAFDDLQAALS